MSVLRCAAKKAALGLLRLPRLALGRRYDRLAAQALGLTLDTVESVSLPAGQLRFACPNDLTRWRIETYFSKEPETLEWIDGFKPGDVLWDVGANVGLYSLYAAKAAKARVVAFEPASANYWLLNRNIELNGLGEAITALCVGLSERNEVAHLAMSMTEPGGSMSSLDGQVDGIVFRQGALAYRIDDLVRDFGLPFPNHVKIDVDGIEDMIVRGAAATFADPRIRSVVVELSVSDTAKVDAVTSVLTAAGLSLTSKRRSPMFDDTQYADIHNFRFDR